MVRHGDKTCARHDARSGGLRVLEGDSELRGIYDVDRALLYDLLRRKLQAKVGQDLPALRMELFMVRKESRAGFVYYIPFVPENLEHLAVATVGDSIASEQPPDEATFRECSHE